MAAPLEADSHIRQRRERLVLAALAAVQFTTIVDFMVVIPLGPQLMNSMGITAAQFGNVVASYSFAAGVAGIVAASMVDRFPRRTAFLILYGGFLLGTLFCALAPTYHLLLAARILTGAFGGILGGMAMAIIGDVFPEERRGRATGSLMNGFSLASVAGVPLGLWFGNNYGWHTPFIGLAVLGLPVLPLAAYGLPRLDSHVGKHHHALRSLATTFTEANHISAFALTVVLMVGNFAVFTYLPTYLIKNVGMNENEVPFAYVVGGALTLRSAPLIGKLADHYGKLRVYRILAPMSALLLLGISHLTAVPAIVAIVIFGMLMVANSGRMVAAMAMVTSSVLPSRRGGFLSANSAVQHLASCLGASLGGLIITESAGGRILHFGVVGWFAALSTLTTLWLAGRLRVAAAPEPALAPSVVARRSLAAAAEATADVGEPLASV